MDWLGASNACTGGKLQFASCSFQGFFIRLRHKLEGLQVGAAFELRTSISLQFAVCSLQLAVSEEGQFAVCRLQIADFERSLYARKYAVCRLQIAGCKGSASAKALLRELSLISRGPGVSSESPYELNLS